MQRNKVADILARKVSYSCSGTDRGYGACIVKMLKSDMLQDACGHCWCPEHQHRGELLNWAAQHGYPAITFRGKMRYAIGVAGCVENKMFWKSAILMGNEDMINAAIAYIGGQAS